MKNRDDTPGADNPWRRVWDIAFAPFDNGPGKGIGDLGEDDGIAGILPLAWPTIGDLRCLVAQSTPPLTGQQNPAGHVIDLLMGPIPADCYQIKQGGFALLQTFMVNLKAQLLKVDADSPDWSAIRRELEEATVFLDDLNEPLWLLLKEKRDAAHVD